MSDDTTLMLIPELRRNVLDVLAGAGVAEADLVHVGESVAVSVAKLAVAVERADTLGYLAGRRRAALTIADKNPDQAERARDIAQQIAVQIESIEQGLHDGAADLEALLQTTVKSAGAA